MALKKPYAPMAAFSMSSMTDVIFLLLIFFMVTSTLIFPAAIDVDLPQSGEQTALKPTAEVYIDSLQNIYFVADRNDSVAPNNTPVQVAPARLEALLDEIHRQDSTRSVALYADKSVRYGKVIDILEMGSKKNIKVVLATRAADRKPQ